MIQNMMNGESLRREGDVTNQVSPLEMMNCVTNQLSPRSVAVVDPASEIMMIFEETNLLWVRRG